MKIKTILFLLLAFVCFASAQWNLANPKYGGNFQARAGYQYDTEADTVTTYEKFRAVVDGNIEVMVAFTDNQLTSSSIRFDIFDVASPFLTYSMGEIKAGSALYYDLPFSVSLGAEAAYLARAEEVEVGGEIDYFFWKFLAYAGGTYTTNKTTVPYVGLVYNHSDTWEVGVCVVQIYSSSDLLTTMISSDITLKF